MSGPLVLDLGDGDVRSGAEFWLDWAKGAEWKFSSYYKYRFAFRAAGELLITAPDQAERMPFTAIASTGGDAGDIYRFAVTDPAIDPMTWDDICGGGETDLTIRTEGGVLFSTDPYLMPKRDENGAPTPA